MKTPCMAIQRLITLPPGMSGQFHKLEKRDPGPWYCGSDPGPEQLGSGGGTAAILAGAYEASGSRDPFPAWLSSGQRMVIHSGGESRRLPAYSTFGKSLIPMPVFRWSKGQYLDQKLLDFQSSFYEKILKGAPQHYAILIGSGDVMFISPDRFRNLPEADVLLFGIWVEDATAQRHGVFFSHREQPGQLAFVKQKPSLQELREWSQEYLYLMDSGIVMLSAAATMKLMAKSGWDPERQRFREGIPGFYDLYGGMLTAFGSESASADEELSQLKVRLHPLLEAEFYHFGSNLDLIDSSLRLQNRVVDQRLKLTREGDHHPSIFQQNSQIAPRFTDRNHHIWIENCHIPGGWKLNHHHILTGVPENDWELEIPEGICLDLVPVGATKYCLRLYGFSDGFGERPERGATWMGKPLNEWLRQRSVDPARAGIAGDATLYDLPLFPLIAKKEIPLLIASMLGREMEGDPWLDAERLSASELSRKADAGRSYSQRQALKVRSLPRLAANHHKSIFYYMDLQLASEDYREAGLELPEELSGREPVIKRINDNMFRARVSGNGTMASGYEREAFGILREEMVRTLRSKPLLPHRNLLDDQILWGRSPVRLDLAGGWTDTPPYCIMEGGKVVNLSVELNGQLPLQVFARPLEEHKIVLRSIDLGAKLEISTYAQLHRYDKPGSGFSIPMAALVLAGFGPEFSARSYPDLEAQLRAFGCGIEMSLLAAIPKGSGLGTSSNLAATVLGTLSDFCGLNWDKHEVAYRTLILEQMLTTGGGWQDQYGGIFEGVKLLETAPGIQQRPGIKWLPDQLFSQRTTRELMLLYYTGVTRVARDILGEIVKAMFLNSSGHLAIFKEMKEHAGETFETILRNDYQGLAGKVADSWELNQRLDVGTNPPVIQHMIRGVEDYLLGYKLLGAGGGGYLFMCAKSPEAAGRVRHQLESDPPNPRARFVEFSVSTTGFQVSRS